MLQKRGVILRTLMICSSLLIFSGCIFQPKSEVVREFHYVDYDAPALRLARPIKAHLLQKNEKGEWVEIGKGEIPAGAYIKGRKPSPKPVAVEKKKDGR